MTNPRAVAVVGMGCRFPGGASNPNQFWDFLVAGRDGLADLEERWPVARPSGEAAAVKYASFLQGPVDRFDPAFFGISPREAVALDPQQRLVLEIVWEALEDAGIPPARYSGRPVGVFVGAMLHDFYDHSMSSVEEFGAYRITGSLNCFLAGRVSYTFGFRGPSLTVGTQCSSSLTAIHLAVQSLRQYESEIAITGGVSMMLSPSAMESIAQMQCLAPDGRCKTFDKSADGFGRGEGCGVIVLKRLEDALRDGDRIRAVIRGSSVNHDGRSVGLTVPNATAQQALIEGALSDSGIAPSEIGFVETHGTGTALGDPLEVEALREALGGEAGGRAPCVLGALKSNIGHLEAASGVAGVIKTILALEHEVIPKNLNFNELNPRIELEDTRFVIASEAIPWPRGPQPRRAGISAFGLSGTNVHVILEEAPEVGSLHGDAQNVSEEASASARLFPLSARSDGALRKQAARLQQHLSTFPDVSLVDVAHTLSQGRTHFPRRTVAVASTRDELLEALDALGAGAPHASVSLGRVGVSGSVAFVFPGQGSQWSGMGRQLFDQSPVFRAEVERCATALSPHVDWSLVPVIRGQPDAADLTRVDVVQPALFAMMVSLAAVWRSHGIEPDAVVGHSQGEIAAAYVAGALSLEHAARVVALRSRALVKVAGKGTMAAVELPSAEVLSLLAGRWDGQISVAAINSARSTIVSGAPSAIDALLTELQEQQLFARKIRVNIASHSAQMDELREELLECLAEVRGRSSAIPLYSTVTGEPVDGNELGPEYWYRNLRQPVRFAEAAHKLLADGSRYFVEASPHPLLSIALETVVEEAKVKARVVGSLTRDGDSELNIGVSLGELYAAGRDLDWSKIQAPGKMVTLPTYAFDRQRCWLEVSAQRAPGLDSSGHPLLGASVETVSTRGRVFVTKLSRRSPLWLRDYQVFGEVLVPGTAFLEMCQAALERVRPEEPLVVCDLTLESPLLVPEAGTVDVHVEVSESDDGGLSVEVYSRTEDDEEWILHASGRSEQEKSEATLGPVPSWPEDGPELFDESFYPGLHKRGQAYGAAFQGVRSAVREEGGTVLGRVSLREDLRVGASDYGLHPALLDAALHLALMSSENEGSPAQVSLPVAFRSILLWQRGASELLVRCQPQKSLDGGQMELSLWDRQGKPVGRVSLEMQAVDADSLRRSSRQTRDLYEVSWQPVTEVSPARSLAGRWVVVAESGDVELATSLVSALDAAGVKASMAGVGESLEGAFAGQIRLWPVESPDEKDVPERAKSLAAQGLLELQEKVSAKRSTGALVWLTRGAVATGPGDSVPALWQAPLWGLGRSARSECPSLELSLLDLGPQDVDGSEVVRALGLLGEEPELAARSGVLLASRLGRPSVSAEQPPSGTVPQKGTVLVTGGLGALGLHTARWLAGRGVKHLLLTSRRGMESSGAAEAVAELEGLGASVTVAACDVSDRSALSSVLSSIPKAAPLRGVVHCAGVIEDGALETQTTERLEAVLRPKVNGAWYLHELTRKQPLELFVLYSSAAGVTGNPGQSNYAAANVFMDQLAWARRNTGLCALSLSWGSWQDGGVPTGVKIAGGSGLVGDALSPKRGMDLLALSLERESAHQLPWPLQLRRVGESLRSGGKIPALWRNLVRPAPKRRQQQSMVSVPELLAPLSQQEHHARVSGIVREEIAHVLGLRSPSDVAANQPLQELGLDSLMAVKLRNRLATAFSAQLRATVLFEYPTVETLTRYLLEVVLKVSDDEASQQDELTGSGEGAWEEGSL